MSVAFKEFQTRVDHIRQWMKKNQIDVCFVYGDEYRRENLRYISNNWPIFERGAAIVSIVQDPVILGAPEGEMLCREMCPWPDIRLVPEFACVSVPDHIEYPFANYTSFKNVFDELRNKGGLNRLGIVGLEDMSHMLYKLIEKAAGNAEIVDAREILLELRKSKTDAELENLKKAASIADIAYEKMLRECKPGMTELELAGIAIGEATKLGAETCPFCIISSGPRLNTIIGRPTEKVIEDGEMVMAALAVQYGGYISTFGFPFVMGNASEDQKQLISWLVEAYERALKHLKAGEVQSSLVKAVKGFFAEVGLTKYDLYPPLHGCGLSEAESPYPNENTKAIFEKGMTVNTDVSVFGHPYGSNRIEASFVVTEDGYSPMSQLILRLLKAWKERQNYQSAL